MPLSCSCDFGDYEPDPGQWEFDCYWSKIDFEPLTELKHKLCISCGSLIYWNEPCLKFPRARHPHDEIEAEAHGVDWEHFEEPVIKISPAYSCEKCGEIWLNLESLGFECLSPAENMPEMLKQYISTYNPQPLHGESKIQKIERLSTRKNKRFIIRMPGVTYV